MMYLDTIKTYAYMVLGFIVMGFMAVYKYRGVKIKNQQKEIDAHEAKDKAQGYEADNRVEKAKAEGQDVKDTYPDGTYTV